MGIGSEWEWGRVDILLGMQMGYYMVWMGPRIAGDVVCLSNYNPDCLFMSSGLGIP